MSETPGLSTLVAADQLGGVLGAPRAALGPAEMISAGRRSAGSSGKSSKQQQQQEQQQASLWARIGGEEYARRSQIRFSLMATNRPMVDGESHGSSRSGTFIWTWGAGFHGQLGRKTFPRGRKVSIPVPSIPLEFPAGVTVCQVASGGYHTMALADDGRIFSWGHGTEGQLGYPLDGFGVQNAPREVDSWSVLKMPGIHISCGQEHSAAVSKRGEVYCWGLGKSGQLGHGNKNSSAVPIKVRNVDHAASVSCGSAHTVVKTKAGRLFTWGEGNQGQLGHGNLDDLSMPKAVTAFDGKTKVKIATCGATLTAVITEEGDLMMCGLGDNLFAPKKEGDNLAGCSTEPMHMFPGTKVKQVACGRGHVVLLDEAGDVWSWGNNNYCQLGDGSVNSSHIPRCVMQGKHIESVCCGRYHTLATATCGLVYSWGCDESGQLGHAGAVGPRGSVPKLVNALIDRVCGQITCGEHHNCVITSGEMYAHNSDWLQFKYYEAKEYALKAGLAQKFNTVSRANLTEVQQLIEYSVSINKMKEQCPERKPALSKLPISPWKEDGSVRPLPAFMHGELAQGSNSEEAIVGIEDEPTEDPLDNLRLRVNSRFGQVLDRVSSPRVPTSPRQVTEQCPGGKLASPAVSAPSRPQTANEPEQLTLVPQPPSQPRPKSPTRASIRFLLENAANIGGPTKDAAVQQKIVDENRKAERVVFDSKFGPGAIAQSVSVLRDKEKHVYKKRGPTGPYEGVLLPRMLFYSETERLLQKTRRVTQSITTSKSALTNLQGRVHRLRIKHDSFFAGVKAREKRLAALRFEYAASQQQQQIRDADMEEALRVEVSTRTLFESVLSRVAEVDENIESSMFVISQLKQEVVERRDRMEEMKTQHREGSMLHRRLGYIERKAKLMADECDNQLSSFKTDIQRTRREQTGQVDSFKSVLHERYEASQQASRLAARKELARKRELERAEKEFRKSMSINIFKQNTLHDSTVAQREEYFRQGFLRVKQVSKMESVEDIIRQHFVNKDTKELLNENKYMQAQRLAELQAQKAILTGQLNLFEQSRTTTTGQTLKCLNTQRDHLYRVEQRTDRLIKMVKDHKATLIKVDHSLQYHVQRAARICVNVPVPALVQNPDNVDYLAVLTEILLGAQTECVNAGCEDKPGALVPAC